MPPHIDGERVALLVAAVAGTVAGLLAAEAGTVAAVGQFAAVVAGFIERFVADPLGVTRGVSRALGQFSAAHLAATGVAVATACAVGALRGEYASGDEGWGPLLWRYAVAALLGVTLWWAVTATGPLRVMLWIVYLVLAAVYLGESWRGAGRYPFPLLARWLLAVSGVLSVLLVGFRGQYGRTVLAPLYRAYGGIPALVFIAALPAAVLVVLNTAAVASRIGR